MNLEHWIKNWFANQRAMRLFSWRRRARFGERIFGQNGPARLESDKPFMSLSLSVRRTAICFCLGLAVGIPAAVFGQTSYYRTNGTEYAVVGSLLGDQVFPDAAVTTNGGFVVWQDNITDGSGWGVSARRLDSTLSGTLSTFRVNVQGTNDQRNPRVALLKKGGAVFVWQGGNPVNQHIYARFLTPTNTFLTTTDLVVSTFTNNFQINPAVAVLNNSNVVVVWASFNQAGSDSLQDVYGQILSTNGTEIGTNFLINQFISYNQRTPAVAALANGGFVVAWVSEQERSTAPNWGTNSVYYGASALPTPSVDIYARLYNGSGVAQGNEFLVDTNTLNPCANPGVAAAADGSFMVAWGGRDMVNPTNGWDIYARTFSSAGVGGATALVNTHLPGNQYAPHLSAIGRDYLVVWTSLGQDGSREGVYGQFVHEDGSPVGGEFCVNTTTAGQQMQPVVASDGVNQFITVWTGYIGSPYNFDLFAQRYADVSAILEAMDAPFVYAPFMVSNGVYRPQLQVSWPSLLGISVSNCEVYVDGAGTPMVLTTNNSWTMTAANGLAANSTHSFQLIYTTTDGRRSPISPSASGTAWLGYYWGTPPYAIPVEWMTMYFGPQSSWPSATADSDGDGMNNCQEFLAGTIPTNSASVLRVQIGNSPQGQPSGHGFSQNLQGMYLSWNTQPGFTYQVQVTTNFTSWSNLGSPRFAAGSGDSIFVGGGAAGYYRVLLLRQ
jgi:hypothetical protein